jgi:hypothetical protein
MKISLREYQRRCLIPLGAIGLAAFYLMVFVPVKHRAESLDGPLRQAWQRLAVSLEQTNALAIDFLHITNQLGETRQALASLESARQKATARFELSPALRAKLGAPFELVDFQNERSKEMDELMRLGKESKVTIEAPVFSGFPEHTADLRQPAFLWPALAFADTLLHSAIECKIEALHSLEVPVALTNSPPSNGAEQLVQIPIEMEFSGPLENILKLTKLLPLRGEEARAAGFTNAPADKPVLLLERLFIKKQVPEKPDEARVFLRVTGFVLQEERASQ